MTRPSPGSRPARPPARPLVRPPALPPPRRSPRPQVRRRARSRPDPGSGQYAAKYAAQDPIQRPAMDQAMYQTPGLAPDPSSTPTADDLRRGACPALSAPMQTGDGLLARIALTDAIAPASLASLARLALQHGNGMLDISARGNLQIRGLSEQSAPRLDADVRALTLPLRDGLAVETPPLAGLDPEEIADPRPLAAEIAGAARNLVTLAPKMSVVVDGHGQLTLSALIADIRLVAIRSGESGAATAPIRWKILLGGIESSGHVFATLPAAEAVAATTRLLEELANLGPRPAAGIWQNLIPATPVKFLQPPRRSVSIT